MTSANSNSATSLPEVPISATSLIGAKPTLLDSLTDSLPQILYDKYKNDFAPLISLLERKVGITTFALVDISRIITYFSIDLVPKMMGDVGKITALPGTDKKELIISSVKFFLKQIFLELDDTNGDLPDYLEEAVLVAVKPTIEVLIQVENDQIVFNTKTLSWFQKLCCCCSKKK